MCNLHLNLEKKTLPEYFVNLHKSEKHSDLMLIGKGWTPSELRVGTNHPDMASVVSFYRMEEDRQEFYTIIM